MGIGSGLGADHEADVLEADQPLPEPDASCDCFRAPQNFLVTQRELGMDEHYAQVTLLACPMCGQRWLRYFYEIEAFTASGRWYLGAISAEQAARLTAESAKGCLEALSWYFYGGSYYRGNKGRTSGKLDLVP